MANSLHTKKQKIHSTPHSEYGVLQTCNEKKYFISLIKKT